MDLSIIIVNWNTRELLSQCLESVANDVRAFGHDRVETFVVDNASTDGSAETVRERFPWVRLIASAENLGFAAGNNLAMRQVSGRCVLLLNPDTVVIEGALSRLWHVLDRQSKIGIVGAQLLNADASLQTSTGVFPSLWSELPLLNRRLRSVHSEASVSTPEGDVVVQCVDWVSGACLMIKREVIESIGLLDEDFWLYTEETDWCYRARVARWDICLIPQSRVYHLARAASGQRFVSTMLHFYQSRVRFVQKHRGSLHASLLRIVLHLKALIWQKNPGSSPLHLAYPDLSDQQIISAYRTLIVSLKLPLPDYLSQSWR